MERKKHAIGKQGSFEAQKKRKKRMRVRKSLAGIEFIGGGQGASMGGEKV